MEIRCPPYVAGIAALVLAVSPGEAQESRPTTLTPAEWRSDLDQMVAEIEEHHFRPYLHVEEAAFHAAVDSLRKELPRLGGTEIVLRMAEIVALLEDAHTRLALPRRDPSLAIALHGGHAGTASPRDSSLRFGHLPVRFGLFDDGLFVTRTAEGLERLRGARVEAFGEVPVDSAVSATQKLAFADNRMTACWYAPDRLALPQVLAHLGLAPNPDSVPITVVRTDGEQESLTLSSMTADASWADDEGLVTVPLARQRPDEVRWWRLLPEHGALYVQIDELVWSADTLWVDWLTRAIDTGEEAGVERLVLDLRHNFGGSGSWNEGLVRAINRSSFDDYGRLYVLIGRRTFSAAFQLVEKLEVMTQALFVGESTGSRPGHFGDPEKLRLGNSGLTLRVAELYWSPMFAGDAREAIAPHLPVRVSGRDWLEGADPVLEAALEDDTPRDVGRQIEELVRRGMTEPALIHYFRYLMDPDEDHATVAAQAEAFHRLLDDGHVAEAAGLFDFMAQFYPTSAEAAAGAGRAREVQGEMEAAREQYERALELDPDHRRARQGLERLEGSGTI